MKNLLALLLLFCIVLLSSCVTSPIYVDGGQYIGELKDGKPNGQGTVTLNDVEQYVGEWKDGKRNGQGTYNFANGNKYVGEFKDDKRNGQG